MATARELVVSADHQTMSSLGAQQVESLGRLEAKFDALLTVLNELKENTSQIVSNTSKDDEENHKAAPNPPTISPLNQSAEDGGQAANKDVLHGYEMLHKATLNSDWNVASKFLDENPEAITKGITNESQTVLHVAIMHANLMFIKEVVKLMPLHVLEHKTNVSGNTALHYAAMYGYVKAAEVIVNKNPNLTQIKNEEGRVPLDRALTSVTAGQRETVEYLYSVTRQEDQGPFSGDPGVNLLCRMIDAGFYDIASSIVQRFPELIIDQTKTVQTKPMDYMAERPFAFASGAQYNKLWQRCIYSLVKVNKDTTYELDTQAKASKSPRSSDESLTQRLEGTNADEENPPENSKNSEGDEATTLVWEKVGVSIYAAMLNFFFVFLLRFIQWTPVNSYKQLYHDKVKHKQAKDLVRNIFTQIRERMNHRDVISFFERSKVMKMAIRHGSVEFVEVCVELFPYLLRNKMRGKTMIQMAIAERNETILNLLCKKSGKDKLYVVSRGDNKGNTILHYAAKLAPSAQLNSVRGAYLQMQREVKWFKGVENMIPEIMKFKRNENGDTAQNIFTEKHKELKENGEKWLKDTSGSCMLVAALIATVAFTSAFTVPGGNISGDSDSKNNGLPVFLSKDPFVVFAVADALALFSSITSVLMFLAIYTSRYAETDFLKSLPKKLMIGLATLLISMASILVAFGASLFIMLGERYAWALIPIVVFSCVPVALFAWLQLPLFVDMIRSTYRKNLFQEHAYISSLQLNAKKHELTMQM